MATAGTTTGGATGGGRALGHNYDEDKIKSLSSLEHIRKRSGMYIGRVGDGSDYDDGIYVLLKEVVDNAIDEFIMGFGDRVFVRLEGPHVTVRDYGRGIPLGKVVECVSRINTGAKYSDEVFQFSVGLNGIGTKAVNALSSHFEVRSHRGGEFVSATFRRGRLVEERKGLATEPDGTFVCFEPDPEIFAPGDTGGGGAVTFVEEHVERRLKLYSFLNAGLKIDYNGRLFLSRNGLTDLLKEEASDEMVYPPLHFQSKTLEFAFSHTQRFAETFFSFVNGQYTSDGGTHLSAFREGLVKGFNEFAKGKFDGDDIREGMAGAVSVRLKEPVFESQTKNKLGNTELRSELVGRVKELVADLLHRNPKAAETALAKIQETVKLRKELQSVKKMARERARATSIRVPQLKDCKVHFNKRNGTGSESMVFITEGLSAAGSIVSCRDVATQAVFTMRGKPLNVCDLGREVMYKNEELYNLMRSLDIEDSTERLRYGKVILATDADVDGLHIRNLLLTFFLRFFEPIVDGGFVHILETPLFRVRNAKKTTYCYSEAERDEAVRETRGAEITRFKGLGEISPSEFKHFIGARMRLAPVRLGEARAVPSILGFYMGRNTPERKQYIMDHLVVDAES
ncbi:MAG: type IIA DNA topoisomerase subunit B [Acidobacteriota bacterium]|jgi:DNA gyrase subunit B/topoisomerase-4 subunit B|nr:type IIA DNA topoisomerase subunit B [Acidobacteriota bacterium]